jgi:hypothetical protein
MILRWVAAHSFVIAVTLVANVVKAGDCPVVFQQKVFTDGGDFVSVHGTLTGDGVPYKYNNSRIDCSQQRHECLVTIVDSIGEVGGFCQVFADMPIPLEIVQWTPDRIIASYDNKCGSTVYLLDRHAQTVEVTQRATPEKPECAALDKKLGLAPDPKAYHWTIEDPPFWKDWKTLGPAKALDNLSKNK